MQELNPANQAIIQEVLDKIAEQQREEERQARAKKMYVPLRRDQIAAIFWSKFSETDRRRATTVGDNVDILYQIYLEDFNEYCADLPDWLKQKVS